MVMIIKTAVKKGFKYFLPPLTFSAFADPPGIVRAVKRSFVLQETSCSFGG